MILLSNQISEKVSEYISIDDCAYLISNIKFILRGLPRGFLLAQRIPRGLPREPTGDGVSKGESRTPLWSPSARVSRAGEILQVKIPRPLGRGFLFQEIEHHAVYLVDLNSSFCGLC